MIRCVIARQNKSGVALQRNRLFDQSRLCHWCRQETHLFNGTTDPLTATLDHVLCRAECQTIMQYRAVANKVLSCHSCNQRRKDEYIKVHGAKPHIKRRIPIPRKVRMPTPFDIPVKSWRY